MICRGEKNPVEPFHEIPILTAMRFLCVALLLLSTPLLVSAQKPTPSAGPIPEGYRKLFQQAVMAYEQQNFEKALGFLEQADELYPNYSETYNLKGGIYTQQRDYEKARALFTEALALNEKSYPVRFNLAEIAFLEKQYGPARQAFEQLENQIKADKEVDPAAVSNLLALIRYKVFLTYVLEDNLEAAKGIQSQFSFTDPTPNYYFAQAALAFQKGDRQEAQTWLSSADRIYRPQLNRLYADSFFEVGWIEKPEAPPTGQ